MNSLRAIVLALAIFHCTDSALAESVQWLRIAENNTTIVDANVTTASFPKDPLFSILIDVRFLFSSPIALDNGKLTVKSIDRVLVQCAEKKITTKSFTVFDEANQVIAQSESPIDEEARQGNLAGALIYKLCPKNSVRT
jgi:hypothetical protein